jgi:hypothetical protein
MDNNLTTALSFFENNDFKTALSLFKEIIQAEPNNGEAYYYAAESCNQLIFEYYEMPEAQQYELKLQHYIKKGLAVPQNTSKLYQLCAQLYQENRAFYTADELLLMASTMETLEPNSNYIEFFKMAAYELQSAWHLLIPILENKIQQKQEEPLTRSNKDGDLARSYAALAFYHQAANDTINALATYKKAWELAPDDHDICYNAGLFAYENNAKEEAYLMWSKMYTWQKDSNPIEAVGDILCKEITAAPTPSEALLYCLTEIAIESDYKTDNKNSVYQQLEQWGNNTLQQNPNSVMVQYLLARSLQKQNKNEACLQHYEKYLAAVQNDPITLSRYMIQRWVVDKQIIDLNYPQPNGTVAYDYYNAGCLFSEYIAADKVSVANYKQVRKNQHYFYSHGIELFRTYFEKQQGSAINNQSHIFAMCCHNAALVLEDDNTTIALQYEELSVAYSPFNENITQLIKLYNKTNQHSKAKLWIDKLNENAEEQEAFEDFDTEETPDLHTIIWDINNSITTAETYLNTHQEKEAVAIMEQAFKDFGNLDAATQQDIEDDYAVFSRIIDKLAKAHKANYGQEALIAQYERGLEIMPDSIQLINNLGYNGYHKVEAYDDALRIYTSGINLYLSRKPDYENAYQTMLYNRGLIYQDVKKDTKLAWVDIENSFTLVPTFNKCIDLVNLAYNDDDMVTAQKYAQLADTLIEDTTDSNVAWVHGMHGVILKNLTRFQEATPYFEKCFKENADYQKSAFFTEAYQICEEKLNTKGGFFSRMFKK